MNGTQQYERRAKQADGQREAASAELRKMSRAAFIAPLSKECNIHASKGGGGQPGLKTGLLIAGQVCCHHTSGLFAMPLHAIPISIIVFRNKRFQAIHFSPEKEELLHNCCHNCGSCGNSHLTFRLLKCYSLVLMRRWGSF